MKDRESERMTQRFAFRVGFPVLLVLVVSISASMGCFYLYSRSQLDSLYHRGLISSAQSIRTALETGMMTNDRVVIQDVIREGKKKNLFADATILNSDGRVVITTNGSMKRSRFSVGRKECLNCHQPGAEGREARKAGNSIIALSPDKNGRRFLHRSVEPILLKKRCADGGCHAAGEKVAGFLMLDYDNKPIEAVVSTSIGRFLATGVGTLLLICGVFLFVLNCNLNKPMRRMMRGIERVGGGDFDHKLPEVGAAEFAKISGHFNKMADNLKEHVLEIERKSGRIEELTQLRNEISQMNQRLNQKVLELYMLHEVGKAVNSTLDLDVLFQIIMEMTRNSLGISDFCLFLYNEETKLLEIKVDYGLPESVARDVHFEPGEGVTGMVFLTGEHRLLNNVAEEPNFRYYKGAKPNIGSFLSTPLIVKGKILGVLNVDRIEANSFKQEDIELYSALANQIAIAIENARMYEITKRLSHLDSLTGIYNHGFFQNQLREMVGAASMRISLLMLDIDNFKRVNDTYGHGAGDIVLKEISNVIQKAMRGDDVVARYGGEEFAIILPDTNMHHALMIAERIRRQVEENRFVVPDSEAGEILVTVSIGVSQYFGGMTPEAFVDAADRALYEAKTTGRNKVMPVIEGWLHAT